MLQLPEKKPKVSLYSYYSTEIQVLSFYISFLDGKYTIFFVI